MWHPKCATLKQYVGWRNLARVTRGTTEAGFCTDCTAKYQASMMAQGRCQHPEVQFNPYGGYVPAKP